MKNPRINGQSAFVAQAGAGLTLTPTISWDVPTLGEPEEYQIRIWSMTGRKDRPSQGETVATIHVPRLAGQTAPALQSVTLPPGILKHGTDYYFTLVSAFPKQDERNDEAVLVTAEYRP